MAQVIQFGKEQKPNGGEKIVEFPTSFKQIPKVVVVTPFWERKEKAVTSIETINTVSCESFTIFSGNHGTDYYVNWIAISEE